MRAVIQRVSDASVEVDDKVVSSIHKGIVALIGFHSEDSDRDIEYIIKKILNVRIFDDENGMMNLSVAESGGEVLLVSQFTLYGTVHKGNRPSFSNAMEPVRAENFYNIFIDRFKSRYERVKTGIFGANMKVSLNNSGPVTILIESNKLF